MTDDQVIPPAATPDPSADPNANPVAPGAPQKTPLEILEEILGKQKAAGSGGASAPETAKSESAPDYAEAERLQKLQAIEQEEAVLKARDDAAAAQTLQQIKDATQDPNYQAVVEQEKAVEAAQTQQQVAQTGFEIKQLTHKKI